MFKELIHKYLMASAKEKTQLRKDLASILTISDIDIFTTEIISSSKPGRLDDAIDVLALTNVDFETIIMDSEEFSDEAYVIAMAAFRQQLRLAEEKDENYFWSITTLGAEIDSPNSFSEVRSRTVGIISSLDEALVIVENNSMSLDEDGWYKWLVIEKLGFGLYPISRESRWYSLDQEKDKWVALPVTVIPTIPTPLEHLFNGVMCVAKI